MGVEEEDGEQRSLSVGGSHRRERELPQTAKGAHAAIRGCSLHLARRLARSHQRGAGGGVSVASAWSRRMCGGEDIREVAVRVVGMGEAEDKVGADKNEAASDFFISFGRPAASITLKSFQFILVVRQF